jgi:geranylgeranyl diphosphate synthase type I
MGPIQLAVIRQELQRRLTEAVEALLRGCGPAGQGLLRELLPRFVLCGGKRLRPQLLLITARGGGRALDAPAWDAALGLELLHSFALLHDDVIDDGQARRQRTAFHAEAANRLPAAADAAAAGRGLAVLAGDILHAAAMRRFQGVGLPAPARQRLLATVSALSIRTGAGVFAEVEARSRPAGSLDLAELEAVYRQKTAEYSFVCPMRLGAILAGLPPAEEKRLARIATRLGVAYQLRDDLDDLAAVLEGRGEESGTGFVETKIMLAVQLARRDAPPAERAWLDELYAQARPDAAARRRLAALLARTNAREAVEARLRQEAATAMAELRETPLRRPACHAIAGLAGRLLRCPAYCEEKLTREGAA